MRKKIFMTIAGVFGVLLIAAGAYAYHLYGSVKDTANRIYEPVDEGTETSKRKPDTKAKEEKKEPEPISILLMGVDEREHDAGRSDTMIVLTLNPEKETMQMVSIPRDTRTKIVGKGIIDKINHSYAFGGTKMAMDTVNEFLDMDLDYYIRINMEGLVDLVDAVGGITVYNDDSWTDPGYYEKGFFYHEGELQLNGAQALGYVRMRYIPGGDFTRNKHQREVIEAIVDKAANVSSLTRYKEILQSISDNVKTNITFDEMTYIAQNYRAARKHVKTYAVKGNGTYIDGIYYLLVPEAEQEKVHDMIMKQLRPEAYPKAKNRTEEAATDRSSSRVS